MPNPIRWFHVAAAMVALSALAARSQPGIYHPGPAGNYYSLQHPDYAPLPYNPFPEVPL